MSRYARQTLLPGIGAGGQAAFAQAHLLVVGAGGWACRRCNIWPAPESGVSP
ncbi:hypothetical protein [Gemmobacter sp. 24YEA27]|uniref:hypothetical protein n=1 Tax=Gemmobacter sp. 24YEA27 TaxID=3040672 RepID=UPI0032C49733